MGIGRMGFEIMIYLLSYKCVIINHDNNERVEECAGEDLQEP